MSKRLRNYAKHTMSVPIRRSVFMIIVIRWMRMNIFLKVIPHYCQVHICAKIWLKLYSLIVYVMHHEINRHSLSCTDRFFVINTNLIIYRICIWGCRLVFYNHISEEIDWTFYFFSSSASKYSNHIVPECSMHPSTSYISPNFVCTRLFKSILHGPDASTPCSRMHVEKFIEIISHANDVHILFMTQLKI